MSIPTPTPQPQADASSSQGQVWPSPRYHQLVEDLRRCIGREVYLSIVSFNGAFRKEGQPYRLLDVIPFPKPRAHPHPPKRAYPHMLVLESVQSPEQDDQHWHSGLLHGGAINLAHVGSVTTRAYPRQSEEYLYANLDLLSAYYACPARQLLERRVVPARICVESTGGDLGRLIAAQGQGGMAEA